MSTTASAPTAAVRWGADSEYGVLRDVLLCQPEHFRWLPTSSISKATLAAGSASTATWPCASTPRW